MCITCNVYIYIYNVVYVICIICVYYISHQGRQRDQRPRDGQVGLQGEVEGRLVGVLGHHDDQLALPPGHVPAELDQGALAVRVDALLQRRVGAAQPRPAAIDVHRHIPGPDLRALPHVPAQQDPDAGVGALWERLGEAQHVLRVEADEVRVVRQRGPLRGVFVARAFGGFGWFWGVWGVWGVWGFGGCF